MDVAAFACDPDNATRWYETRVGRWRTAAAPSRLEFVARFMGRRLAYTYEVREHSPGERFVMSTAQGPFPMETTYAFEDTPVGTRMTLRNRGEPAGFAKIGAPLMERAMRRANHADLRRIKEILER